MIARAIASLACVSVSCAFQATLPQVDAGSGEPTITPDAVTLGGFGPPVLVASLSDPNAADDDPTVTADLLELYFDSDRLGGGDVYRAKRGSVAEAWGAPELVAELSGPADEEDPEVSDDGLTMWLASTRGSGNLDVYVSTRATRDSAWSAPALVAELSSGFADAATPISSTLLMVVSDRAGSRDLYLSARPAGTGPWGTPQSLVGINTPMIDQSGYVEPSQRYLFFASDRDGNRDVFVAERTAPMEYGMPQAIAELAHGAIDSDPWVSADLRYIVFASHRTGGVDIYEAHVAD